MIVFNLSCEQHHAFEGWFGSAIDMASQQSRGLLSCPVCGSSNIEKQLSAPRLNLLRSNGSADESEASSAGSSQGPAGGGQSHVALAPEQAQLREMIRQVIEHTENVGHDFPEEARRIHYHEAPARFARGG